MKYTGERQGTLGSMTRCCRLLRGRSAVAYPELVSGGVSKSHKFKWLVKVGAGKGLTPDL